MPAGARLLRRASLPCAFGPDLRHSLRAFLPPPRLPGLGFTIAFVAAWFAFWPVAGLLKIAPGVSAFYPNAGFSLAVLLMKGAQFWIILQIFHLCAAISTLLCAVLIKSHRDRTVMLGDLDHHMKSIFGTLQMVAYNTAQIPDCVDKFNQRYAGRRQAMPRYHRLLSESEYRGVRFDRLITDMLFPHFRPVHDRIVDATSGIALPGEAAQALGMALHEVATNAVKHGALAAPAGPVTLRCVEVFQNGRVWLGGIWIGRNTPIVRPVQRQAFGVMLVKSSFEDQLKGRVSFDFRDRGPPVEASFPAPSVSS